MSLHVRFSFSDELSVCMDDHLASRVNMFSIFHLILIFHCVNLMFYWIIFSFLYSEESLE